MRDKGSTGSGSEPAPYEIVVRGRLDDGWSEWLNGMEVRYSGGVTRLTGPLADQPALLGLLLRLGNMNLTLLSVKRLEAPAGTPSQPCRVDEEPEEHGRHQTHQYDQGQNISNRIHGRNPVRLRDHPFSR